MKKEDIEFLRELKRKIAEGDHAEQAPPRFWMVRESATRPVGDPDMADETLLVNPEDGHVWTDDDIDSVKLCLEEDAEEGGFEDDLAECGTVDEVIGVMEENRVVWSRSGNAEVCYLERYWRLSDETGAFLTMEDCQKHIVENRYHYSEDAHPYALTAWRNPAFERLLDIVANTDWEKEKDSERRICEMEKTYEFEVGEPFVYQNGDRFEIGIVKRRNPRKPGCYFCWYSTGDTAACTDEADMRKIANAYAFRIVRLDPNGRERGASSEEEINPLDYPLSPDRGY